jgi:hypothetical protein
MFLSSTSNRKGPSPVFLSNSGAGHFYCSSCGPFWVVEVVVEVVVVEEVVEVVEVAQL